MWGEIQTLKQYKPVVASMSDYAASGGYYMAMGCDQIVAYPSTVTGSIGVFGVLFTIEDFLQEKLGITTDGVKTNPYADLGSPLHEMSKADSIVIQNGVEDFYQKFITKAAEGRNMSVDQLDSLASGRVWTGRQALEVGLIDTLGGLEVAVKKAAGLAALEDYAVSYMIKKSSLLKKLGLKEVTLQDQVQNPEIKQIISTLNELNAMRGVQARAPFSLSVR
jgi:protease-4